MHIWKILKKQGNVCVPYWVPRCAGISIKISSMLISKQEFLSVKVRKKSKYPITFKFVFLTNVAQFSANEH